MPIYVYLCKNENCKREVEKLMFKDEPTIKCENCGSTMGKIPTFSNFVVNGYNENNGYSGEKK